MAVTFAVMMWLMACMTGCGSKDEPIPEPEIQEVIPEESVEDSPEEEEEPAPGELTVIGEREVVNGEMQSYLTGEWIRESAGRDARSRL